jgi:putative acetyltransferase
MLIIRRERPEDRPAVYEINRCAFETDTEARLVEALRGVGQISISLVDELDGRVVGHILFTHVSLNGTFSGARVMGLAPVAVLPEFQNQGIGSALVRSGLEACQSDGTELVFVLGHPDYNPRFGFQPVAPLGLHYKEAQLNPYFFVLELAPGALDGASGTVAYHPLFEEV